MDSLVGSMIGQYQIIEEIGRGGMAIVYKAYQPSLNRYVALKVLPPHLAHDQSFVVRFLREANIAANLKHPGIIEIYEVSAREPYYLTMPLIEGETLATIIRRDRAIAPNRVAEFIEQVASALDYAHQRGVIHRDVKPANILIDRSGKAILTDFGIAKAIEGTRLTQTGGFMGTPEYVAPEQIRGLTVDSRTDVYALGIVCYEMLSGRVPFQGDTLRVLHAQAYEAPPPLRSLNPRVSPAVEQVVRTALAKSPAQRYARAGEFANALTAEVSGAASVHPRVSEPPTRYLPQQQRKQSPIAWVLASVSGAVVLLIMVSSIALNAGKTTAPAVALVPTATGTPEATRMPTPAPTSAPTDTSMPVIVPTYTPTSSPVPTNKPTATTLTQQKRLDPVLAGSFNSKWLDKLSIRQRTAAVEIADLTTNQRSKIFDMPSGRTPLWTGEFSLLNFPHEGSIWSAVWSLAGQKVLIAHSLYGDSGGYCDPVARGNLTQVNETGKNAVDIALANANDAAVRGSAGYCWNIPRAFTDAVMSPDGQRIAFLGTIYSGNRCTAVMNMDGSTRKNLDQCEADDHPRFWSTDGKWVIAWSDRGLKLYAYEADGNRRVPVEQLGRIQMYDERYWPWKVIDSPVCKGASFWECE